MYQWTGLGGVVQVECVVVGVSIDFVVWGISVEWMTVGISVDWLVKRVKWMINCP